MSAQPVNVEPIPAGLTREQVLDLYYHLAMTRVLEERLVNLYRQGKVIGGLYRSVGQEGESVAAAYALQSGDVMSPLLRNLGAMLVMGARPVDVLRQYMAKGTGPSFGREMNIHFNDLDLGYLGQISPLGDMVAVMAGIALSFKIRNQERVGLVFIGDGGTSTGTFHEAISLASVQRLPLVVVMEHNGYAYSTPTSIQTAVKRLATKAKAYGVPGITLDGNDVFAVYEGTRHAVDRARNGGGTTLIEVVTYRRQGHAEHDDQRYQSEDEIKRWEGDDPVDRFSRTIRDRGWVSDTELQNTDERVKSELDSAVAECEHDPMPQAESALDGVFRHPERIETLWFRGEGLDG
jgi:pyruvate dehydrogenase E1 component alpha subunit/2-oxoisovalerate dehydrogenase E1 component alpha subunit